MRPLYLKATEDGKEIFARVVITKSVATVDILTCSPDKIWTTKKKPYDLTNVEEKREYSNFLERHFDSSYKEFDAARKQMIEVEKNKLKEANSNQNELIRDSVEWRKEILRKISDFRNENPDTANKDK